MKRQTVWTSLKVKVAISCFSLRGILTCVQCLSEAMAELAGQLRKLAQLWGKLICIWVHFLFGCWLPWGSRDCWNSVSQAQPASQAHHTCAGYAHMLYACSMAPSCRSERPGFTGSCFLLNTATPYFSCSAMPVNWSGRMGIVLHIEKA